MAPSIKNVEIVPRSEALKALDLAPEEFFEALDQALKDLEGSPVNKLPSPADITLVLGGLKRHLGELARISFNLSASTSSCLPDFAQANSL